MENVTDEINDVITSIVKHNIRIEDKQLTLYTSYTLIDRNSLTRWIKPVVSLLKIVDTLIQKRRIFDLTYKDTARNIFTNHEKNLVIRTFRINRK